MKNSTAKKLKQIPEGYALVGIDPHKKKHGAAVMTQDAMVRSKFKVSNSKEGAEKLLARSGVEMEKAGCSGVIFAIEAGGHYWRNLGNMLENKGIPYRLVSQFTLKRRREGRDHNRQKNDYVDAEMAAELLRTGEYTQTELPKGVYAELRGTYNAYCRIRGERTRTVNLIKSLLDGVFPEFTRAFKDICGQTALGVLRCGVPPVEMAQMETGELVDRVRQTATGKRLMVKKVMMLREEARETFGVAEGAEPVFWEISCLAERLQMMERQFKEVEVNLKRLVESIESSKYLLSVTGIGLISVAGMLAELGPLERYSNGKQLVKMAGTNPTESESGGKRGSRTPMSKKGRSRLRHCVWEGAVSLLRHNADFQRWARERQERPAGKHPLKRRSVVGAIGNRLLRLTYALVRDKAYYQMPVATAPAG